MRSLCWKLRNSKTTGDRIYIWGESGFGKTRLINSHFSETRTFLPYDNTTFGFDGFEPDLHSAIFFDEFKVIFFLLHTYFYFFLINIISYIALSLSLSILHKYIIHIHIIYYCNFQENNSTPRDQLLRLLDRQVFNVNAKFKNIQKVKFEGPIFIASTKPLNPNDNELMRRMTSILLVYHPVYECEGCELNDDLLSASNSQEG